MAVRVAAARLLQKTMGCALEMVPVDTLPAARALACSVAASSQHHHQQQQQSCPSQGLAPNLQQKRPFSTAWVSSSVRARTSVKRCTVGSCHGIGHGSWRQPGPAGWPAGTAVRIACNCSQYKKLLLDIVVIYTVCDQASHSYS